MKIRFAQYAAVVLACVGMLLPPSAMAAPAVGSAKMSDVALREGGLLVGQVVDAQGKAIADTEVSIQQGGAEVVRTVTDKSGVFAANGLRGGEYQVVAGGGVVSYRLWAAQTAPPIASNRVLVVTGDTIINGQNTGGVVGWIKSHPLVVAAGLATAIAVPLAVADDDDPSS